MTCGLLKTKKGFTLVEIIVVTIILVIGLMGILGVVSVSLYLNDLSKNLAIALADARSVLEKIRDIDPFNASALVAAYPDGVALTGDDNLLQEVIRVDYEDLTADPIKITVTVSWQEKNSTRSESLVTLMTQR